MQKDFIVIYDKTMYYWLLINLFMLKCQFKSQSMTDSDWQSYIVILRNQNIIWIIQNIIIIIWIIIIINLIFTSFRVNIFFTANLWYVYIGYNARSQSNQHNIYSNYKSFQSRIHLNVHPCVFEPINYKLSMSENNCERNTWLKSQ